MTESTTPPEVREALARFGALAPATLRGAHPSGWAVEVLILDDPSLTFTEAPGGYLVTSPAAEGVAVWIDQSATADERALAADLAANPGHRSADFSGVLMQASQARTFGFPRMSAVVLRELRGADPWIVLIGSTKPVEMERGIARRLPSELARLEKIDAEFSKPSVKPEQVLAQWARAHGADEAYRVMREPSPHGGPGWCMTVWRAKGTWRQDIVQLAPFTRHVPLPGVGAPIAQAEVDRLLEAVEASSFWTNTRPPQMGLDGYLVLYGGWRDGQAHERTDWCPTDPMFAAFASIAAPAPPRRSWLGCGLALLACAAAIGAVYAIWW